jgi:hypothetical protein
MSATGLKQNQNDIGYYIGLTGLLGQIFAYSGPVNGNTGTLAGTMSTATWAAAAFPGGGGRATSTVSTVGAILKDLGKTVVSSNRTFRKVQLVLPNSALPAGSTSTFGVGGRVTTTPVEDYLTGYIELGFDGFGTAAPVAHFGR